jgi:outer membrane protein OmpA-like peptidoglycan-associated protein
MPEPRGKCLNSTVCSLAQEGRILTVAGEMRCPECGGTLQPVAQQSGALMVRLVIAAMWVATLGLAVWVGWKLSHVSTASTPPIAEAPAAPSAKPAVSTVSDTERQEVLKRIDQMPNVTAANKERLYVYVERAQKIKRVLNVSFEHGGTKLSESAIKKIVEESHQADFANQARDPAIVFVVLGYADKNGDATANHQVSSERATHVEDLLRKRCNVTNVIQTVPMGSSDLFSPQSAAENRVAEVWAVLP